jgi:hypothetical protein
MTKPVTGQGKQTVFPIGPRQETSEKQPDISENGGSNNKRQITTQVPAPAVTHGGGLPMPGSLQTGVANWTHAGATNQNDGYTAGNASLSNWNRPGFSISAADGVSGGDGGSWNRQGPTHNIHPYMAHRPPVDAGVHDWNNQLTSPPNEAQSFYTATNGVGNWQGSVNANAHDWYNSQHAGSHTNSGRYESFVPHGSTNDSFRMSQHQQSDSSVAGNENLLSTSANLVNGVSSESILKQFEADQNVSAAMNASAGSVNETEFNSGGQNPATSTPQHIHEDQHIAAVFGSKVVKPLALKRVVMKIPGVNKTFTFISLTMKI